MTNKDKEWKRKFIAFLKENNIYEKWIYNMKHQHPVSDVEWWNLFFHRIYENRCSNGINYAFYWADTEDGHLYWSNFDRMWKYNCGVIRSL